MKSFGQYLHEISSGTVQTVTDWERTPPFEHIFKGKQRIVLPSDTDPIAASIKKKLDDKGAKIDWNSSIATYTPPVRGNVPKQYQKEPKERQQKLGRLILKDKTFSKEEKEWWQKAATGNATAALKSAYDDGGYQVLISRHPVDVVRMSDHIGMSSCHSAGGMYHQCAISEAMGQGGIAYLVKAEDLAGFSKEQIEGQSEIFTDRDRGVGGIRPLSRVRIRRYVNRDEDYDLAIPEVRVYGTRRAGFKNQVSKYLMSTQKHIWQNASEDGAREAGERPSMDEFMLVGGSYRDTRDDELFNNFFGDDMDHGEAEYGGDEEGNMAVIWEEEIEALDNRYNDFKNAVYAQAEVEDYDGGIYVSIHGGASFEFPKDQLTDKAFPKRWGHDNKAERDRAYKLERELEDAFDYGTDLEIGYNDWGNGNGNLRLDYRVEDEGYDNGPDRYESYLHTIDEIDRTYNTYHHRIWQVLYEKGYVKPHRSHEVEEGGHEHDFTYFNYNADEDGYDIWLKDPIMLGSLKDANPKSPTGQPAGKFDIGFVRDREANDVTFQDMVKHHTDSNWSGQKASWEKLHGFEGFENKFNQRLNQLMQKVLRDKQQYFQGMQPQGYPTQNIPQNPLESSVRFSWDRDHNVGVMIKWDMHVGHDNEGIKAVEQTARFLDRNYLTLVREMKAMFQKEVLPYWQQKKQKPYMTI